MAGVGYGFRYESPGAGAAGGFESGVGLGLRAAQLDMEKQRQQQQMDIENQKMDLQNKQFQSNEQQRQFEQGRQTTADEQTKDKLAEAALDKESGLINNEASSAYKQYGGPDKIPDNVKQSLTQRASDLDQKRHALYQKRYAPIIQQQTQRAQDFISGLQSGRVDISQADPKDVYMAFLAATGRDPSYFQRQDGKPSEFDEDHQQIQEGMQSGNQNLLLQGANGVMQPDLSVGVGQHTHGGLTVTGKQIDSFVPSKDDPSRVMPVLKVQTDAGSYHAPVTASRGTEAHAGANGHEDTVKSYSMDDWMQKLGHMGTIAEIVNQPDVAAKLEQGRQQAQGEGQDFLQALSKVGFQPPKKIVTHNVLKLGDRDVDQSLDEQGNVIGEKEYKVGATPRVFNPNTGVSPLQKQIAAVQQYAEDNDMDPQEAAQELQSRGLLRTPSGGPGTQASKIFNARIDAAKQYIASHPPTKLSEMDPEYQRTLKMSMTPKIGEQGGEKEQPPLVQLAPSKVNVIQNPTKGESRPTQAPTDPKQRKAGAVYMTPKGPLTWTGTGWRQ